MSWYRRLLNLVRSDRVTSEIDRELAFHVAEAEDELVASGLSRAEAAREARRRFGNYGLQKERTRDVDVLPWLESLVSDVRYGWRALRASPGLAAVAILSLGLGIGANTAIFSLINAVLLRPLPVQDPQELVQVQSLDKDSDPHERSGVMFTNPLWEQVRDREDVFSGVFAVSNASFDASRGSETRAIRGSWVSGAMFSTLGVQPLLGRMIARSDDVPGCPAIAVLGHSFWQSEYGGDAGIVGKTIALNSRPAEIVGVADARFTGVVVGQNVNLYVPICAVAALRSSRAQLEHRSIWWLRVLGRPRPGVTLAQVNARLAALAPAAHEATVAAHLSTDSKHKYTSRTIKAIEAPGGISYVRDDYRSALLVLMGIVGLVLLVACANLANLLLARATTRQGEVAIRLALGASRGRLVRQLLTESMLLSFLGACAGVLFARWSSRFLVGFISTRDNDVALDLSLDLRVLGFTILVAAATGVLFGLAPAWRSRHVDPQSALKRSGRTTVSGHSRFNLGKALVVGQVALSLVLVAGAGLLVSTFWRLASMDPGFARDEVLIASLDLRRTNVKGDQPDALYDRIRTRLEAIPSVHSTSMSEMTPVEGGYWNDDVLVDGFTPKSPEDYLAYFNRVGERYFETLGMRLLSGRDFSMADVSGAERVAIVNQTLARRFFGTASPLGRQFRVRAGDGTGQPIRIVGVVSDAKIVTLREETLAGVYLPDQAARIVQRATDVRAARARLGW